MRFEHRIPGAAGALLGSLPGHNQRALAQEPFWLRMAKSVTSILSTEEHHRTDKSALTWGKRRRVPGRPWPPALRIPHGVSNQTGAVGRSSRSISASKPPFRQEQNRGTAKAADRVCK